MATKQLHIVIPYIMGPEDGIELRYALRSIEKNFKCKEQVIVNLIGDKPDWCENVNHVEVDRVEGMPYMVFLDVCNKIKTACELEEIGNGFIYMYDDTCFIQPTTLKDIQELKALEDLGTIKELFKNTTADKKWCNLLKKTMGLLQAKNLPVFNYETHCPRYFNVKKMLALYEEYNPHIDPVQISTLYFNTYFPDKEPRILMPWGDGFKLGIYRPFPAEILKTKIRTNKVMNIGKSLIEYPETKEFLNFLFPKKSKYEED